MLAGVPFLGLLVGHAESAPEKDLGPLDCGVSTRTGSVTLTDDAANDQVRINIPPGTYEVPSLMYLDQTTGELYRLCGSEWLPLSVIR